MAQRAWRREHGAESMAQRAESRGQPPSLKLRRARESGEQRAKSRGRSAKGIAQGVRE